MEEIIHYLELKNHYYEKFLSLTKNFLNKAKQNLWDDIEFFVDNRERILNIIRSFDIKVSRLMANTQVGDTEAKYYREKVKAIFDRRTDVGNKILAIDLELIRCLDEMKTNTIKELKKTLDSQKPIQSFQSVSTPTKVIKSA